MQSSNLKNKSDLLVETAELLHSKCLYPAVAHASYYSCYQLLKHIWLYSMKKTEAELETKTSLSRMGSHEYLLNEEAKYILNSQSKNSIEDSRNLRNKLTQLKRLRVEADYSDSVFESSKSQSLITLSVHLLPILKRY